MPSPVGYNARRELGDEWDIDWVMVGGKMKKRTRAKGYSANRCTIIGDSIIQMMSNLLYTSVQAISGAHARNMVEMCEDNIYLIDRFDVVSIFAGTNDQCRSSALEILVSLRRIIQHIRNCNPTCRIAICGLIARPVDQKSEKKVKKLSDLNDAIKADCELTNTFYINSEKGLQGKGPMSVIYREDRIHLSLVGVTHLQTYIEGVIGSILGEPPQWDPINKVIIPKK
jgi:hypothetical protein